MEKINRQYIVDVPNSDPDSPWIEVEVFDSRETAIEFVRKQYGGDENGNVCLVSVVDSCEGDE